MKEDEARIPLLSRCSRSPLGRTGGGRGEDIDVCLNVDLFGWFEDKGEVAQLAEEWIDG